MSVYVSIGNSDGKLSPADWSRFYNEVDLVVRGGASRVHGRWHSFPAEPFVNAAWCVEFPSDSVIGAVKDELLLLAVKYQQDAITWDVADQTEFIGEKHA
jgi:hypothetical protein